MSGFFKRNLEWVSVIGFLIFGISASAFITYPSEPVKSEYEKVKPEYLKPLSEWVDSVIENLTLREKIGQLMVIGSYPEYGNANFNKVSSAILESKVGGIIIFKGSPYTIANQNNKFQALSKTPLLTAIDAEWGLAMRVDSSIKYPMAMTLGAIQNDDLIYQMGTDLAEQMKMLGIYMNFAPVVDLNSNPNNPIINMRSFGENTETVTKMGLAYMNGLQDNGILACAKHFPGHGDTENDSHFSIPIINKDYRDLQNNELNPFKHLINNKLACIMAAHLNIPSLDSTANLPATFSYPIVTKLLKEKMGFKGLVITDALNMKGAQIYGKPGRIEVEALKAGNDILLMPHDPKIAIDSIEYAVTSGEISEDDINEKCRKILSAKFWLKLPMKKPVNLIKSSELNSNYAHINFQRKLIQNALTVVSNNQDIIPLKELDTLKIASIIFGEDQKTPFQKTLDLYDKVDHYTIGKNESIQKIDGILNKLKAYNLIILGISNTNIRANNNYGIEQSHIPIINNIIDNNKTILTLFANPYALNQFKHPENAASIIIGYEDDKEYQNFAAQLIFGGISSHGKLPVTTNFFPAGTGIESNNSVRLRYGTPEEAGLNRNQLSKIDSIAQDAILNGATPGCQILVARDGVVGYMKNFGYYTYLNEQKVDTFDIYDIASITKIVSTLPMIMKMVENEDIDIEEPLSNYFDYLDSSTVKDLKIEDILTHQAGLVPYIPFYIRTLRPFKPEVELFSKKQTDDYPIKLGTKAYLYKHLDYVPNSYSKIKTDSFNIEVAENMYMHTRFEDTILQNIIHSEIQNNPKYKYSDLGFYLLKSIIENSYKKTLDTIIEEQLYRSIGANNTMYNPLKILPKERIVPTENDLFFRHQLLQGYVHDYCVAMQGGVGGHAGVFSNANDLAKIMQMYLNEGIYGGKRYFEEKTISKFTSSPYTLLDNRRALGFDKPKLPKQDIGPTCDKASPLSFGHTGFSGTIVWSDPEYNLTYIFLSNRIHPDATNQLLLEMDIRTKIQSVIYNSLDPIQ